MAAAVFTVGAVNRVLFFSLPPNFASILFINVKVQYFMNLIVLICDSIALIMLHGEHSSLEKFSGNAKQLTFLTL